MERIDRLAWLLLTVVVDDDHGTWGVLHDTFGRAALEPCPEPAQAARTDDDRCCPVFTSHLRDRPSDVANVGHGERFGIQPQRSGKLGSIV